MKRALVTVFIILFGLEVYAQTNSSFQVATRLMQQQRYEDALPILKNLFEDQPQVFIFLDRLVECHIQLKQYDEAMSVVENSVTNNFNIGYANILRGELFHLQGDTASAYQVWDQNLITFPGQLQLYLNTANVMTERREFDRAVDVFLKGRRVFSNDDLFLADVPNVYMQAGRYQEAIAEWLGLIQKLPEQSNVFKRMLIRYNDPLLFDDSIAEIEFALREMSVTDASYRTFFDLQNWLLFENNLYRRAYAAALRYELSTSDFNYSLDLVGRQLAENNQFDLALNAFSYYRDNTDGEIRLMALEKLADINARWAKYLQDYNLDEPGRVRELYQRSISILDTMITEYPFYRRIDRIYLQKAELSLDEVYDVGEARQAVELFKSMPNKSETPEAHYLDGRLYLAEDEYTQARIEFTRSNRLAGTGELAEKTRYFLALTDFYSGDFEFAKIQLKTLGRRNTSYYANDALKLRLWLQEGTNTDTTGTEMQIFADAIKGLSSNPFEFDDRILLDYLDQYPNTPFKDDVLLALAEYTDGTNPEFIHKLNTFLDSESPSPLREDLLWMRASKSETYGAYPISNELPNSLIECFFSMSCSEDVPNIPTQQLLEDLILEFPDGFYAPYARQKLIDLPL